MTQRLRQLFSQYSDVIVATFGGHTHKENACSPPAVRCLELYLLLRPGDASCILSLLRHGLHCPCPQVRAWPCFLQSVSVQQQVRGLCLRSLSSTYEIEDLITYQIDAFKSQVEDRLVVTPLGSYRILFFHLLLDRGAL